MESWTYDTQDRLTSHTTPERTTTWQLDAGGRRIQQTVVATAGATGPPASANPLEASAGAPLGTLTYSYNSRDQLTQISGAQSASYTYDAAGNRLSQSLTRSGTTQTTRYRWNAQDQLVQVEQGSGSNPPELLASYRYSADNLRAEKQLSDLGQANASQASAPSASPLAYERTQWDGLHARRSFEITGSNNTQTLRSDTDAAVLAGNTAPWLFSRTEYSNGLGSSSRTTQLHADSQGTLIATVVSESGAAKADSLLHYSAYGLIDSEASGNAGTGLRSNGHSFGSYYADPETGLLYARARYFDPASGQFVSRDPEEGEANLPITWGAYQYGRYSPYRYNDPNGKCDSLSDCSIKTAGGVVGGIGLTAVKAVEGALDTVQFVADGYLGLLGHKASQRRNSERLDMISGVIENADKIPAAVKQAIVNVDAKAQAEDAAGNTFTAAMLRGNYAGEIALAVAGLPQAARSAASLVDAGLSATGNAAAKSRIAARALARELEAAEPALAAKTPSVGPEQVRHQIGDTTPTMVREGPKITATGENVPTSKTARATPSEPCCFAPGTLVATEAGERPIETTEVGDLVWTRLEDGTGQAFLAPVTAIHIRHDRPILQLSVEQVQTGEPEDTTQPTAEDLLVTPGHPFYVAGQGFVSVEDLQQGDELVSLGSGKTLRIKSLVLEAPQGTTHNLTVDVGHTFFVGALGTWVHNVGPCNTCPGGACGTEKATGSALESTDPVVIGGSRAIDKAQSYERGVRGMYGNSSFSERQYTAIVDGRRVPGVADEVTVIGGKPTAVEAKFVYDWGRSIRNPASPSGSSRLLKYSPPSLPS